MSLRAFVAKQSLVGMEIASTFGLAMTRLVCLRHFGDVARLFGVVAFDLREVAGE